MKQYKKELLEIKVYDTRDEMGIHAAKEAADYIRELMKNQDVVNIVFAVPMDISNGSVTAAVPSFFTVIKKIFS